MPQVFDDEIGLKRTKLNLFDQGKVYFDFTYFYKLSLFGQGMVYFNFIYCFKDLLCFKQAATNDIPI